MPIDVSLVWLWFMKQGLRCARSVGHNTEPSVSSRPALPLNQWVHSISVLYVKTFVTNNVIRHEKWKELVFFILFFEMERQALVFTHLKDLIFITRSIRVQITFLSFNGKLYVRDNRLIFFLNFPPSSACDLHDRSQKC